MPEGFKLGSAFIEVDPDADGFKDKLKAVLDKDKTEVKVKVTPDTTGFKEKLVTDVQRSMTGSRSISVQVNPDAKGFAEKMNAELLKDRGKHITVTVDTNKSQLDKAMRDAGGSAGGIFTKAFSGGVNSGGGAGGAGGGIGGGLFAGGIAAAVIGALAVLPATMASLGALSGVALGTALVFELNKNNKKFMASLKALEAPIKETLQQAVQPMVVPLENAFKQIAGWIKTIKPALTTLFSDSAKYLMPFVKGLEALVSNFLPGFNALLKAAGPTVAMFAQSLGKIGTFLSNMFRDFIPGLSGSNKAFAGFIQLLGTLLETIARVASEIAGGSGAVIGKFFVALGNFIEHTLLGLMPALNALLNAILPPVIHLAVALEPLVNVLGAGLTRVIAALSPLLASLVRSLDPIIPVLGKIAAQVINLMVVAFTPLIKAITPLLPPIGRLVALVGVSLSQSIKMLTPILAQLGVMFGKLAAEFLPPLLTMITRLIPPVLSIGTAFLKALIPAIVTLLPSLSKLFTNLQPLINELTKIIPIIVSFAARIEIDLIKNAIAPAIQWIARIISAIVNVIAAFVKWAGNINDWKNLWKQVWTDVQNWWDNIERTIAGALSTIKKNVTNWINDVRNSISGAWDWIYHNTDSTWGKITNFLHGWWSNVINFFTGAYKTVQSDLSGAWNTVLNEARSIWNNISSFFHTWWNNLTSSISSAVSTVRNGLKSGWNNIVSDIHTVWNGISGFFSNFWHGIEGGANAAISAFSSAWGKIEGAFRGPVNFLINTVYDGGIRRFWNDIVNAVGLKNLDLPPISGLSKGGMIPGYEPGIDRHLIAVSGGEGILTPEATMALGGKSFIDTANRLYAGYRGGGGTGDGRHFAIGGQPPPGSPAAAAADIARQTAKEKQLLSKENSSIPGAGILSKIIDVGKIVAALATGNTTALTNGLNGLIRTPANGALAQIFTGIPKTLLKDIIGQLTGQLPPVGGGAGPGTSIPSGSEMANGKAIFEYLMSAAHMTEIAAAGAIASIWGESTWNPLAAGTGGRGLIGWTPPGTLANSAYVPGNPTLSLDRQLPLIIKFIGTSGDWGVISQMNSASSVLEAANLWGKGVERYGINDVHSAGLALATQIMNQFSRSPAHQANKPATTIALHGHQGGRGFAAGTGFAPPGWAWVGEQGPELVNMMGGETVLDAITSHTLGGVTTGFAGGTNVLKHQAPPKLTAAQQRALARAAARTQATAARHAATVLRGEHSAANSIIAALSGQFSGGGLPSANNLSTDLSSALRAITRYYTGAKAKDLENILTTQTDKMQSVLTKYTNVANTIGAARSYAATVTSNLSGFASLSNIGAVPTAGSGAGYGPQIVNQLRQKLAALGTFGRLIKAAAGKHINTSFLQQAIALGPDGGTQYLEAILAGGSGLVHTINSIFGRIDRTETSIGMQAANDIFDPNSVGHGFLVDLRRQETALSTVMKNLGHIFAETVAKDLKIPAKDLPHFAAGGFAPSGTLALVGENGPEIVRFGQDARVYSNAQSHAQPTEVNINFYGTQYPTPEQMAILKLEWSRQLGSYNV